VVGGASFEMEVGFGDEKLFKIGKKNIFGGKKIF
jgi:hypothetical protein